MPPSSFLASTAGSELCVREPAAGSVCGSPTRQQRRSRAADWLRSPLHCAGAMMTTPGMPAWFEPLCAASKARGLCLPMRALAAAGWQRRCKATLAPTAGFQPPGHCQQGMHLLDLEAPEGHAAIVKVEHVPLRLGLAGVLAVQAVRVLVQQPVWALVLQGQQRLNSAAALHAQTRP